MKIYLYETVNEYSWIFWYFQKLQEQLTKQSSTLGRDAVYTRTVNLQNTIYRIQFYENIFHKFFFHTTFDFSRKSRDCRLILRSTSFDSNTKAKKVSMQKFSRTSNFQSISMHLSCVANHCKRNWLPCERSSRWRILFWFLLLKFFIEK